MTALLGGQITPSWRTLPLKITYSDATLPLFLIIVATALQYSNVDIWLASHFYDAELATWPYRDTWVTESVIHKGGRAVAIAFELVLLVAFGLTFGISRMRAKRRALGYLVLATLAGPLLVSILKGVTHLYSPWDLTLFGGTLDHIRLFDAVPSDAPVGHAFPAGHASAGYAFISVYFLLRARASRYQYLALIIAILMGLVFGIDQQIRGAHLLSHDLTSFAICWSCAAITAASMLRPAAATASLQNNALTGCLPVVAK